MLAQQKVSEKTLQIDQIRINTFSDISIICTDKCIAEIPAVSFKRLITNNKTKSPEIFYCKNCCSPCISLSKRMNLPYAGNKLSFISRLNIISLLRSAPSALRRLELTKTEKTLFCCLWVSPICFQYML